MIIIYNVLVHIYHLLIRVSSLFNKKARLWLSGRKGILDHMRTNIKHDKPLIWFHCASLGEFEQGRPVIEAYRRQFPNKRILLTFFSPSGYEIRKQYPGADYIFYLPMDTPKNASAFLSIARPQLAVFVKYEYWFNYIRLLKQQEIPLVFISAIFRPSQRFFSWYGGWQRRMLGTANHFFVQNETSAALLKNVGIGHVTVSGDTRFDRVSGILSEKKAFPDVSALAGDNNVLLAGSTWPQDEELIIELINLNISGLKVIIAPHEVHPDRINALMKKLPENAVRFTSIKNETPTGNVLVIDTIGMLSHLYRFASIAYIGGGFGVGIHNILEAAAFGKPVIFGPNYQNFREAVDLVNLGSAFSVDSKEMFLGVSERLLTDTQLLKKASAISSEYVQNNRGATDIIIAYLTRMDKK